MPNISYKCGFQSARRGDEQQLADYRGDPRGSSILAKLGIIGLNQIDFLKTFRELTSGTPPTPSVVIGGRHILQNSITVSASMASKDTIPARETGALCRLEPATMPSAVNSMLMDAGGLDANDNGFFDLDEPQPQPVPKASSNLVPDSQMRPQAIYHLPDDIKFGEFNDDEEILAFA
ncbi:uncharacterized protein NECHADRAFT_89447 [Fusarium vanettenii 77-13-4]|uniref:Uncharacterized protein n=1 Tax=Fusarium vanettenii (strain ATCC MYA-4622 / CBS 123669 / FGSC 9596 / NRRL 45880 / 77-13-4) TaxID=660122 RepID=C7ZR83_FUSV7|nr:uncharacterized protein NECHADRAFT_89447 [Fusarium vanettenii 77-13-4]EEU33472.1 predicted protein [Fusarium vanettenii 77-13-4]